MSELMGDVEVLDEEESGEAAEDRGGRRVVKIDNKDSGDTIRLRVDSEATIGQIVDKMYEEFRLTRDQDDRLSCWKSGVDVFQYLALTLAEYLRVGNCPNLHWSFISDTGGA